MNGFKNRMNKNRRKKAHMHFVIWFLLRTGTPYALQTNADANVAFIW